MKKFTILAWILSTGLISINAQTLLESKQRVLKPVSEKTFSYQVIDGSKNLKQPDFMYKSKGFLNRVYTETPNELVLDLRTGLPILFELGTPVKRNLTTTEQGLINQVFNQLRTYDEWSGIENWEMEFVWKEKIDDPLGYHHYKLQQVFNGIHMYGGEIIIHESKNGFDYVNGNYFPTPRNVDVRAKITSEKAIQTTLADVKNHTSVKPLTTWQQEILNYTAPISKLVIYHKGRDINNPQLAYHITVRPNFLDRYEYFINAHTGAIIHHYDNTCAIDGPKTGTATDLNNQSRTVHSYLVGSTHYLVNTTKSMFPGGSVNVSNPKGVIWTVNANNTDATNLTQFTSSSANGWSDKSSVSAHHNAGIAFDYYKNTHSRNSINGSGGTIMSLVNVTRDGNAMDNAYWNGSYMAYGNGKNAFFPLAGSLDVAGHEMTHGVVQNTANLEYQGQSGAINESMADVFGVMMDRDDWKIGEDIIKSSAYKNGALRDMSNPHQGQTQLFTAGYQPMNMDEYYSGSQDNGGVHINSGIPNHAFFKLATSITKEKAEQIAYRALKVYLTKSSQFLDLRFAMQKAATDLYGTTEEDAVKSAFDFVKIYDPNPSGGGGGGTGDGDDLDPHPGTAKVIVNDANPSAANNIYRANANGSSLEAISTITPISKVSVTDNGERGYFVASDKTLRGIELDTKAGFEAQGQSIWANVAISPDGSRMAAITEEDDTSIWVYDFDKKNWYQFKLYNPTNTEGVKTFDVDFADAIEWNYSSEYIMYDAQNTINGNSFFDIGILRAWDNDKNDVGDGTIEKVFTSIPDGVSVGNATFTKNSPYIIGMDYIDNIGGFAYVAGLNLLTEDGASGIFKNNVVNYPSFALDDKSIVFNYNNNGTDAVVVQKLKTNKIESDGSQASILFNGAEKATFYGEGERNLLSDANDLLSFDFLGLSPAVKGSFTNSIVNLTVPFGTDITALTPTFTHSPKAKVLVSNQVQTSGANKQNFTNTVNYVVEAEDKSTRTYQIRVKVDEDQTHINEYVLRHTQLYPNPASDQLNIFFIGQFDYRITNSLGQMVLQGHGDRETTVNTSNLNTGVYFLEMNTVYGKAALRFVKK